MLKSTFGHSSAEGTCLINVIEWLLLKYVAICHNVKNIFERNLERIVKLLSTFQVTCLPSVSGTVTRLGYFWKVLVTKCLTKVAQYFDNVLAYFEKRDFESKNCCAYFLATFGNNCPTFYFNIWSHWSQGSPYGSSFKQFLWAQKSKRKVSSKLPSYLESVCQSGVVKALLNSVKY